MPIAAALIQKGTVTIYDDSDTKIIGEIHAYNQHMELFRMKRRRLDEIRMAYALINPLIVCGMVAAEAAVIFAHPVPACVVLVAYFALFFTFGLVQSKLLASSLAVVLLLAVDPRFLILLTADLVLATSWTRIKNALSAEPGYPQFFDIRIQYARGNQPHCDQ